MSEVTGATLSVTWDSVPIKATNFNFTNQYANFDSTSSATTNSGTESVAGRGKRSFKIDSHLYDGSGVKITGATLGITIGGATFKGTSASFDMNYTEHDATNTATDANGTEFVGGRIKCTSKFDALMYRDVAEKLTDAIPTSVACVITFKSGITITGNVLLHQEDITDGVNDICKVSYSADWVGFPTLVSVSQFTFNTEETLEVVFAPGSTTNKELSGTAIILGMSITDDANGDAKVTYSGVFNGTITPAIYS